MPGNPLVPHMSLLRRLTFSTALVAAASILSACDQVVQKSANPTSPLIAGPISGVGITAPGLSQPSGGTRFAVDQQPLTLVVQNSTTNGVRTVYYAFQVAATGELGDSAKTATLARYTLANVPTVPGLALSLIHI